jgi:hypothetical protein
MPNPAKRSGTHEGPTLLGNGHGQYLHPLFSVHGAFLIHPCPDFLILAGQSWIRAGKRMGQTPRLDRCNGTTTTRRKSIPDNDRAGGTEKSRSACLMTVTSSGKATSFLVELSGVLEMQQPPPGSRDDGTNVSRWRWVPPLTTTAIRM